MPSGSNNAFATLGLPARFDIDMRELRAAWIRLSRERHPDRIGDSDSADTGRMARLNEAYETLRTPTRRAEHLLALAGGPSASDDRSVPQDVLIETLELREPLDDASDAARDKISRQVGTRMSEWLDRITQLAPSLENNAEDRAEMRLALNAIRTYERLTEQLNA